MKKILIVTMLFAVSSAFISCSEDIEDINSNPNAPEVVPTNTVFNAATKQYVDRMRSAFNSGRLTLNWVEYWGQNAYADEDRYLFRETSAESLYNAYLTANEFKTIIDLNTDPDSAADVAAVGANENQIAASRIMLAYLFHKMTDTFGDIPYYSYGSDDPEFQALNVAETQTPVFATQEKIYADILKELRESADMIILSEPVFTSGDNIFNGDASKWKKFANSLILRVATRLKGVNASAANSAISAAINDGVMTSNADNAAQAYGEIDAEASPWWGAFITRTDFAVAHPFVNLLKGDVGNFSPDPRLFKMAAPKSVSINDIKADDYEESTDFADYEGIPYAFELLNQLGNSSYSFPSSIVLRPDYSEVLMEYAEVAFLLSENNNWSQAEYENGVRASMEKWGVSSSDIDAFVSSLPPANQENVLNQKYVALYMQSHEAYAEYRRTGFPNTMFLPGDSYTLPAEQADDDGVASYTFQPAVNATDLPFRVTYPVVIQNLNGANRQAAVAGLNNGDTILSKLFWDVN